MMEDLKVTDKKSEIGYYSGAVVRLDESRFLFLFVTFCYRTVYLPFANCSRFCSGVDCQVCPFP